MNRPPTFLLLSACLAAGPLDAAVIRGFVLDGASGEPLPVASVIVERSDLGTTTNLDGYFVLPNMAPGSYRLTVSYLGYASTQIEAVADGDETSLKIELRRQEIVLKEAVVTIKKEGSEDRRVSPRVSTMPVEGKLIRMMPSLGAEMDVLRALQAIPGVKASSDISSALYVRGGSPDQTLILMDHNIVYNPSHLFGLFSTFNADAVKHIELIKGGFPAEYGGRSGSVLEVITNEGNRRKREGMVSLGLISAKGALEGPLPNGRGSYAVSGRRTYFDPMLSAMRKSFDIDLPDYYFYDANGKINLDITDRTTLTLAGYWGDDVLDFNFGPDDDRLYFHLAWGNRTFSGRLRHALGRDLYVSGSVAVSKYKSDWGIRDSQVILDQAVDELQDVSYKGDVEYFGIAGHRVKTGFWISRYDIIFSEWNEDLVFVDVDAFTYNYSAYVQDSWRISPMFELQPGLRGYYHEAGHHRSLDARLAGVYRYDDRRRVKLAVGRYTQWMNLISFGEGFSNFDTWFPIDKSMSPSHSDQVVLGFEWDREDGLELTTEGYYTEMRGVTSFDPMTDRGEVVHDAFVTGRGFASGGEVMLQKKLGRLTGWTGYTLSWTKRRFPNTLIASGEWFYPKWDRRHDFIAMAAYPLSRSWDLSGSWRYNTGQGFTQGLGVYTVRYADTTPDDYADYGRRVLPGSKNNYRFPDDHRLDVTLTYNHRLFGLPSYPAKLSLSIFNVYSRRSYWQRIFDTQENPVKVTDAKLLPILPLLSYEVRF